jgi:hypothetical protein
MDCPVCKGTRLVAASPTTGIGRRSGPAEGAYMSCPACGSTGVVADTGRPWRGETDEIYMTRQLLVYTFRYSRIFPCETTDRWIEGLRLFDVAPPHAGRPMLAALRRGYEQAKRDHRPPAPPKAAIPSEAAAPPSACALFDLETAEIERHLNAMEALLEGAIAALDLQVGDR